MRLILLALSLLLLAFRGENLAIIGVIHSTVPAHNLIMVRVGAKKYVTRLGVWFANRYRVTRIQPRYVTLQSLDGTAVFRIGEKDKTNENRRSVFAEEEEEERSEGSEGERSEGSEELIYYYPHNHFPGGSIYRLVYPPQM